MGYKGAVTGFSHWRLTWCIFHVFCFVLIFVSQYMSQKLVLCVMLGWSVLKLNAGTAWREEEISPSTLHCCCLESLSVLSMPQGLPLSYQPCQSCLLPREKLCWRQMRMKVCFQHCQSSNYAFNNRDIFNNQNHININQLCPQLALHTVNGSMNNTYSDQGVDWTIKCLLLLEYTMQQVQ